MESNQDLDLARQAQSGLRESYEALVRKHHVRILGLCASLLGDTSRAEDAAQEIFIKAYKSLGGFQGNSSFLTWLYRIAANHCLDIQRKDARGKMESLDALIEKEGDRLHGLLAPSADPYGPLEAADLTARILSGLPEESAMALVLREMQGLSYAEIAQAMDCSVDSVKARLRRARQTLQEKLRHFSGSRNV